MIDVKYYNKRGFILCVANTGNYDFDAACLGLVGTGMSEDAAKDSLIFQINQRIKALTERINGEGLLSE